MWYPSVPCSRSLGAGGIPACLAGFQAHAQGESLGVWPGGSPSPHPRGKLRGLAWGSPGPHQGVSKPTPGGSQAQTWEVFQANTLGVSRPTPRVAGVYPSMHWGRTPPWLLLQAVCIPLECSLVMSVTQQRTGRERVKGIMCKFVTYQIATEVVAGILWLSHSFKFWIRPRPATQITSVNRPQWRECSYNCWKICIDLYVKCTLLDVFLLLIFFPYPENAQRIALENGSTNCYWAKMISVVRFSLWCIHISKENISNYFIVNNDHISKIP